MHGEGPTQGLGARARAERTENMWFVSVTLEVSRLSGWLNAYAFCQVEGRGTCTYAHAMRGEVRAGRREGVRRWRRKRHARGKARIKAVGGQGTRRAHVEYVLHVRDLGGVPAGNVRVEVLQLTEEVAHVGDH